jgi:16S rRNA (guanine1516-N2)-methyltransferase
VVAPFCSLVVVSGEPNELRMQPSCDSPEVTLAPTSSGADAANAAKFGVPRAERRDATTWQLVRANARLQLCSPEGPDALALDLDLGNGPLARRLRGARRDEPLPRALGLHRRRDLPAVFDATAGLCRDAMVLAHLGCPVTAMERIPALAFLAHDAVEKSWLRPRLTVLCGDSLAWLEARDRERPAVVCLDPMFEASGSAQVKKDMQVCRLLAGPPEHVDALLLAALRVATERVVVKRAANAEPLRPGVSFAVAGERVRFDVYLVEAPR